MSTGSAAANLESRVSRVSQSESKHVESLVSKRRSRSKSLVNVEIEGIEDPGVEGVENKEVEPEEHEDREHESEKKEEEQEEEIVYVYEPPQPNFIKVEFGDSQTILMNHGCIKKTFVDYVNMKMGKSISMDQFDMCDTGGNLVGLRTLDTHESVDDLFTGSKVYIPCVVLHDENDEIIEVEACLNQWTTKYPALKRLDPKYTQEKDGNSTRRVASKRS